MKPARTTALTRIAARREPRLEQLEQREVPAVVGGLDPSFGTGGLVTTTFGGTDAAVAVAVQPDGKIVVAGNTSIGNDFAVARYNPDGTLDTAFGGGDGKATVNFGFAANDETASGMVLQDDGKIVVVGTATFGGDQDFVVARLSPDGSPDTSFDGDGLRRFDFAGGGTNNDVAFGVAMQGTGAGRKIVVVGSTDQTTAGTGIDFGVLVLNDSGTTATSFHRTAGGTDVARAVAVDGSNRIVVAGSTSAGANPDDFVVMRFTPAGVFDAAFNGGANQVVDFGFDEEARAVAVQPDGRIVAAGFISDGLGGDNFAVLRLTEAGAIDAATFNPTGAGALGSAPGRLSINFGALGVLEQANAVAVQPDGKIVLAGFTAVGGTNDFAAARLTPAGAFDNSFDGDGRAVVSFGGDDQGAAVAVDPNGRIVVAGRTSVSSNFAVARLVGSVEKGQRLGVGGSTDGRAQVFSPDFATGQYGIMPASTPASVFPGFAGAVRTAVGDVNGDGVPDVALMTGPGTPIRFAVLSGVDNATPLIPSTAPFAGSEDFAGGGFVAVGDLDNDGRAEVVVSPDQGGGPRVTIFSLRPDNTVATRANFFGIDDPAFRGGCRAALGDVDGDGVQDVAVAAGFLGGPRVALFDGTTVLATPTRLIGDFFAFPGEDATRLRNGAYVATGDVDGDGFADLVFGGGPGGAPRVFVLGGALVAANNVAGAQATPVANFFVAGNSTDRGGVRVAAADADGDGRAEVVAGSGEGVASRVRVYLGKNFTTANEPATFQDLGPYAGAALPGGVFVG